MAATSHLFTGHHVLDEKIEGLRVTTLQLAAAWESLQSAKQEGRTTDAEHQRVRALAERVTEFAVEVRASVDRAARAARR